MRDATMHSYIFPGDKTLSMLLRALHILLLNIFQDKSLSCNDTDCYVVIGELVYSILNIRWGPIRSTGSLIGYIGLLHMLPISQQLSLINFLLNEMKQTWPLPP
jgi:hypothetical protein